MKIGTYYYPEQWPREQWERDFDNIAAMGLRIVHMAEFAWYSMEPRAGEFQFEWLDTCMEMCRKRQLDVILCTPSAAPPIWLVHAHPEMLPVDEHGTAARFGGRRHYSPVSGPFRDAVSRIVTAMADRYGKHASVIGWQIDNEYGGPHDQSEAAHAAFRGWLQRKYGTIDALNKAWGCQFWNTYYTDLSQILFPPGPDPRWGNPHHVLDGQRFWSWAFADFNTLQADILKPRIGERFLTTNFMYLHPDCDPGDMANDLSLYSWDSYPVTGWDKSPKDEAFRVADPSGISLMHDVMASYTGRWGLMEVQPGQVNWSGVPVLLYPGAVRLWLWTAYAHGAEFVTTYRYRQPRFGIELFHHGLVGPDGVTQTPGGREFVQVIDELERLEATSVKADKASKRAAPPNVPSQNAPRIGLLYDFEQFWYYASLPQARKWDHREWVTQWYGSLARLGMGVEILHPNRPWPKDVAILVAPGVQMVDQPLVDKLDQFAADGGQLVLTCRTALMDRTGQLFEGRTAAPIRDLIGASIEAYDSLPDGVVGHVEMDAVKYTWSPWADLLYAEETTRVLAKYSDQFYTDGAAVTQRKHGKGKGTVTYCGVYADKAFTDTLIEKLAVSAGLPAKPMPQRVQVLRRGRHRIALNYQLTPFDAPAPRGAKFIVGSRHVEPVGVAVWEE